MEDALEEQIKVKNEIEKLKNLQDRLPLNQKKKKKQKQKQKGNKRKALNFQNAIRVLKGRQKLLNGIESGIFSIENQVRKFCEENYKIRNVEQSINSEIFREYFGY